jgi:hypothetical protein
MTPIGHNSTPFIAARDTINDYVGEVREWLDGKPVASPQQAEGLAHLLDMLAKARKAADEARKMEAQPFDDGKAEVQARYKPLLTDADRAIDAIKAALGAWQLAEQQKRDEAARAAREAAEKAQREAAQARAAADADNLAAREAAEAKLQQAAQLAREAARIEAAPVGAKGAYAARRTALVATVKAVEIVEGAPALAWLRQRYPDELKAALLAIVQRHKAHDVPGVRYEEQHTLRA